MPIYVYRCQACGHQFDKFVRSASWDGIAECPACGAIDTERRPSTFATTNTGPGAADCAPTGG